MLGLTFAKKPDNYKVIDELVSRSAQPDGKANIKWLKKHGVTDIINFRMRDDVGRCLTERELASKAGIKYHNIPTDAHDPDERQIGQFLDLVEGIREKGGKVHIHCRAGADRTGMYSWIYKQKHGIGEMAENEKEMRDMGHNNIAYPLLINWIKDFLYKDWGGRAGL